MADPIKAGFDIPLQDPARTGWTPEDLVAFVQGIGAAALRPKAVGMAVGEGLRDGIEAEQVEGLHGPIGHGGDPEATSLSVALGDVHPAERSRPIAVPAQGAEGRRLGLRRVPEGSVHAGGPRTRIADDSQDGHGPATVRVGEQVDQGFRLYSTCPPGPPSRYSPGADGPYARPSSS